MSRIAVVSNRLPPLDGKTASAGGLAVGLGATLADSGGTWLGWDGSVASTPESGARIRKSDPYSVISLSLTEKEYGGYYIGFANRTLWPLFHGRADLFRYDPSEFAVYRAVNARFAEQLARDVENTDAIWVHDYHFFCLGEALRRHGVDLPTGFFLHIPFPAADTLSALPCHREIIGALSAFDLVGFQTENDLSNFFEYTVRHLGARVSADGTVTARGRQFRAGVFPIGIDTQRFAELAASKGASALRERLGGCFHNQIGMIGVDRLDYTKGLDYRLRAFERMVQSAPPSHQRAFLLQIAAPSREEVPEYCELRAELEALSGRINARHAGVDWTPVRYINRTFSQASLAALYRLSRVGLITPLRDGMNLVAKEYVAAQNPDDPGVLVLSRFAGAAERMTAALLVNPYDVDGMATAMRRALEMSLEERRERWSELIAEIREHDVHKWRDEFLRVLFETRHHQIRANLQSDDATVPFVRRDALNVNKPDRGPFLAQSSQTPLSGAGAT